MAIATLLLLALQEGWERDAGAVSAELAARARSLEERLEEISLLNLLTGLYLDAGQADAIRALAREAEEARRDYARRRDEVLGAFLDVLGRVREKLARGEELDEELGEAVGRAESRVEETERAHRERLADLDRRLAEVLSAGQREVIERFEPCIFPPRELADPVRAGQPENLTRDQEERLAELRRLPDDVYAGVADGRVLDLARSFEDYLLDGLGEAGRAAELARLRGIADRARAMADAEFALNRGTLAEEAMSTVRDFRERSREVEEVWRAHEGMSRSGRWLLNPRILPLLDAVARRPAPVLPTGARPRAPSCSSCGDLDEPLEEHERSFAHRAAEAGLSAEEAAEIRRAAAAAQRAFWDLLLSPRSDGRNMALEWLRQRTGEAEVNAWECLSADGELTYGDHWELLNERLARRIRRLLGDERGERFLEHDPPPMEIDAGRP